MIIPRVIPVLLLKDKGLYKTEKFRNPKYVGDPLNAVKIFNEKEVDELIFLDINATTNKQSPPLNFLREIASECFMPLCYGGGIKNISQISDIIKSGVEKVAINSQAVANPEFIKEASNKFGSSTIVVSIDVKKSFFGNYHVYTHGGKTNTKADPVKFAQLMEKNGAGELLINSIDLDGTMGGLDINLIQSITQAVEIPVIACGGVGKKEDLTKAIYEGNASAVAAGSMFVFHGKHRAVLINYPSQKELGELFSNMVTQ